MSITQTQIEEYDAVALAISVSGWRVGTRGVVQGSRGSSRTVEITEYDETREFLDHILVVDVDRLRLVRKHRPGRASVETEAAADEFRGASSSR